MLKLGILPLGDWQRVEEKEFWKKTVFLDLGRKHYAESRELLIFWGTCQGNILYNRYTSKVPEISCYIPETSSRINIVVAISVNLCNDCKYEI